TKGTKSGTKTAAKNYQEINATYDFGSFQSLISYGQYKNEAYLSSIVLIVFTILATLLYHFPDFTNYKKSIPFWANISLIGGLLLIVKIIEQN
ncbi:MAG: DoxX family protein, partial [Alphaproteobacteria bacterium]|nr:DoxX family protein [Alphaproteobacteria bacterium]